LARRRVRLSTIGHILTELARQYRCADLGTIPWADAHCASRILREMRQCIEGSTFEQRISALEAAAGAAPGARPNSGAYHRPDMYR
jgi:hypothetical protein